MMITKKIGKSLAASSTSLDSGQTSPKKLRLELEIIGCITSGILLGLVVLALMSPESGLPKVQDVLFVKNQLENDIQQLQTENARLFQEIEAMQTDPFWQEKIAREELNMALPGEMIYKFSE